MHPPDWLEMNMQEGELSDAQEGAGIFLIFIF